MGILVTKPGLLGHPESGSEGTPSSQTLNKTKINSGKETSSSPGSRELGLAAT
jgi:hypothetical protein